jgi:hypothetical protein
VARCRRTRRRPAPSSAPASRPSRTAPASSTVTGPAPHEHGQSTVLAHWRRRAARLPPSPLLSSPTPSLLFPAAANSGKGETPSGLVCCGWGLGVPFRVPVKAVQGKSGGRGVPIGGDAGAVMRPATSGRPCSFSVTGRGQKGKLPLVEPPRLGHGCVHELGVRASSAAWPSHPCTHVAVTRTVWLGTGEKR